MKFVKTGKYKQDALDCSVEIKPLEEAQNRLKKMNYLLEFVRERSPDIFSDYVDNLLAKYQDLLEDERAQANPFDLDELLSEYPHMNGHRELTRAFLNYFLQILQIPSEANLEKYEVINRNYFQSWSYLSYHNLLVLTETIEKAEAISLYKRFITHYNLENRNPNRETIDNLETLYAKAIKPQEVPSDWVIIRGMIGDGKYAFRNENCLLIDASEDLPDSELKYYVCCYGDFEKFKDYHDSIILTMEHTLAQGDPYCSRVLHDTRVDWDLRHPPKSFWDSMESENE
ncbi:MAG: L-2-amino-thiazoline-4-carboxylic acid hydrolase [Candidatus Thorarchaeota archaeon]